MNRCHQPAVDCNPGSAAGPVSPLGKRLLAALPTPPPRLLVAVSGGPDSTALLLLARELFQAGWLPGLTAAHYDHALRAGSAVEAEWVAGLCKQLGLDLLYERRSEPLGSGSRQAAARRLRYRFLESARVLARAELVLTAHTADDAVEGMLLHLLRGSALAGLRGLPDRRERFLRPLTSVTKPELLSYLATNGQVYLEDPSNADPRFARSWVRGRLLPALEADLPNLRTRLLRIRTNAVRWQAALEAAARPLAAASGGRVQPLREAPALLRMEALRRLYVEAGGQEPGLSRSQLSALSTLIESAEGGRLDLPGGIRFEAGSGAYRFAGRAGPAPEPEFSLKVRWCPGCRTGSKNFWMATFPTGVELELTVASPGLRLGAGPGRARRLVSDLLGEARVPRWRRATWPVVAAGGEPVWLPGITAAGLDPPPSDRPHLHADVVERGGQLR